MQYHRAADAERREALIAQKRAADRPYLSDAIAQRVRDAARRPLSVVDGDADTPDAQTAQQVEACADLHASTKLVADAHMARLLPAAEVRRSGLLIGASRSMQRFSRAVPTQRDELLGWLNIRLTGDGVRRARCARGSRAAAVAAQFGLTR